MNLKEKVKRLLNKKWILLFFSFFFFFFAEDPYLIGIKVFFAPLLAAIMMIDQLTSIFMPIIIGKLSNKFGNIQVAKLSLIVLSMLFFILFFYEPFIFIIIFIFPFFLRFFNSSLTPFVSKSSSNDNRSFVFAIRDIFLYLGAALGSLLSAILVNNSFSSFLFISKIFAFMFLAASVVLYFIPKENKTREKINASKFVFSFSLKEIKHKKQLMIFTIITVADSWIALSLWKLPIYVKNAGLGNNDIFSSFTVSFLFISFIGLLFSIISKEKNLRKWYLFDIAFDFLPLTLIIFGPQNLWIVMLALILFQFKDFIAPISIAYFFNCFEESEANNAWVFLVSSSSLITLPFTLLIPFLFGLIPVSIFILGALFIPFLCVLILLKLPKMENPSKKIKD